MGMRFQLTAARRRLHQPALWQAPSLVSTHSRPKAAAALELIPPEPGGVSTHSRPKAAAQRQIGNKIQQKVSTHSRPKAAALVLMFLFQVGASFNSQPPEGGCISIQLNAHLREVSTHSRPKAAAPVASTHTLQSKVSTHSRPKAAA